MIILAVIPPMREAAALRLVLLVLLVLLPFKVVIIIMIGMVTCVRLELAPDAPPPQDDDQARHQHQGGVRGILGSPPRW